MLILDTIDDSQKLVLNAIMRGLTNQEIANELGYEYSYVKYLNTGIYKAYGVKNRAQLILKVAECSF